MVKPTIAVATHTTMHSDATTKARAVPLPTLATIPAGEASARGAAAQNTQPAAGRPTTEAPALYPTHDFRSGCPADVDDIPCLHAHIMLENGDRVVALGAP